MDAISAIPDITGDGSMEMVAGGREGKLYCYSGGLNSSVLNADFVADTTFGYVPFDVQFTDLTVGEAISWEWDFDNDGNIDSDIQNPVYTYTNMGTYTVSLVVSNGVVSDTAIKLAYINADSTVNTQEYYYELAVKILPNPFIEETTITYSLSKATRVSFNIYDLEGEKVVNLLPIQNQLKGNHSIKWNGTNTSGQKVNKGIYIGQFRFGNSMITKKIILY